MKKFFFLLLIFSGVLTLSCSRKKLSFSKNSTKSQELIFQLAMKHKLGKAEYYVENLYYPEKLDKFFFRHTLENGESLYLIEKYYPDCKGKIDCYGFAYNDFDNGNWVDSMLDSIEEERLANELMDLLENDMEVQSPIEEPVINEQTQNEGNITSDEKLVEADNETQTESSTEESSSNTEESSESETDTEKKNETTDNEADTPEVPSVEVIFTDSMNRLRSLEYGKEIFVPQSYIGKSVVIHSFNQKVVRNLYDSQYRITKKETWNIASIEDSKIEIQEEFFYDGNSDKLNKRIVKSKEKELEIIYDSKGHAVQNKTYLITGENGENKTLKSEMKWTYDEDGNLTKEQGTEYEYADGVLVHQSYKEQVYVHHKDAKKVKKGEKDDEAEDEIPPVYEYYENGKLKIRTEHTSKNDYTTKIYFEDDYVVTTYYENNKKVKDVYTVGGVVKRTKTYE